MFKVSKDVLNISAGDFISNRRRIAVYEALYKKVWRKRHTGRTTSSSIIVYTTTLTVTFIAIVMSNDLGKKCVQFNLGANKVYTTYSADEYDRFCLSVTVPFSKMRSEALAIAAEQQPLDQKITISPISTTSLLTIQTPSSFDKHTMNVHTQSITINNSNSQDHTCYSSSPPTAASKRRRPEIMPLDLSMIPNAKRRYPPSSYDFTPTPTAYNLATVDELCC
ncbi:hypothetical protein BDF20DRAFT_833659 [Mycotypha africana]|uniref:uncharacterized protein n=1 Tax=Mycotypha africana TaxID=64632 RepID=UPI0023003A33|nr:uncharacterized protein BDF20DRAFT_833659 [Mycotypha africana]KAI8984129.1 hypothetical protein BDF20DRAFT_833659 [Mycotypha africana]